MDRLDYFHSHLRLEHHHGYYRCGRDVRSDLGHWQYHLSIPHRYRDVMVSHSAFVSCSLELHRRKANDTDISPFL